MKIKFITSVAVLGSLLAGCSSTKSKFSDKKMSIENFSEKVEMDDSSKVFSGRVDVTMMFKDRSESNLTGAKVKFHANARSAWHSHPKGQLLVVTHGHGLVQQWGQKARKIEAGQVVWTPPGVKHWHGAHGEKEMTHLALQNKNSNGKNVHWLEKVSDDQYKQALSRNE